MPDSTSETIGPDLRPRPLCVWQVRFFEITAPVNLKYQGRGQTENPIILASRNGFIQHGAQVNRLPLIFKVNFWFCETFSKDCCC